MAAFPESLGAHLKRDEPLSRHTSLKVGGPADFFLQTPSKQLALETFLAARRAGLRCLVIGGGSNLLVADAGVEGVVITLTASGFRVKPTAPDQATVEADSGCSLSGLARRMARQGWAGLEWAASIPGTIGGAVVNNAGAFGGCIADVLKSCQLVDDNGRLARYDVGQLGYAYRTSVLKRGELGPVLVLSAEFTLRRGSPEDLARRVAEVQERRTETQPRQLSAGSVFANPPGDFAGRLIEMAGLKGTRIGGAQISPTHGNFIVNLGSASAWDVYHLLRLAQDEVWRRSGIWLVPEIQMVGRWPEDAVASTRAPASGGAEHRSDDVLLTTNEG